MVQNKKEDQDHVVKKTDLKPVRSQQADRKQHTTKTLSLLRTRNPPPGPGLGLSPVGLQVCPLQLGEELSGVLHIRRFLRRFSDDLSRVLRFWSHRLGHGLHLPLDLTEDLVQVLNLLVLHHTDMFERGPDRSGSGLDLQLFVGHLEDALLFLPFLLVFSHDALGQTDGQRLLCSQLIEELQVLRWI